MVEIMKHIRQYTIKLVFGIVPLYLSGLIITIGKEPL
jgi:hypothetical protein